MALKIDSSLIIFIVDDKVLDIYLAYFSCANNFDLVNIDFIRFAIVCENSLFTIHI